MPHCHGENRLAWYALQIAPRSERNIAICLERKGFEVLLPLNRKSATRSPPPFFPGYLFCRFDPTAPLTVLTTPGVRAIVGYGRNPVPIEPDEVRAIQALTLGHVDAESWPDLCPGHPVKIVSGPLCGLSATLARIRNEKRVLVNVHLLQRSVLLEIPLDHVTPVASI